MFLEEDEYNTIVDLGEHSRWNMKGGKASYQRYKKTRSPFSEAEMKDIKGRMAQEGAQQDSIAKFLAPETSLAG